MSSTHGGHGGLREWGVTYNLNLASTQTSHFKQDGRQWPCPVSHGRYVGSADGHLERSSGTRRLFLGHWGVPSPQLQGGAVDRHAVPTPTAKGTLGIPVIPAYKLGSGRGDTCPAPRAAGCHRISVQSALHPCRTPRVTQVTLGGNSK